MNLLPGREGPTGTRLPPSDWEPEEALHRMGMVAHAIAEHGKEHCDTCLPGHDMTRCLECIEKVRYGG